MPIKCGELNYYIPSIPVCHVPVGACNGCYDAPVYQSDNNTIFLIFYMGIGFLLGLLFDFLFESLEVN